MADENAIAGPIRVEYDIPLRDLLEHGFTSNPCVELYRYRFLDCAAFCSDTDPKLRIVSVSNLADCKYAAISYVWDGLPPSKSCKDAFFAVNGAGAHPVNIQVLRSAIQLALLENESKTSAPYIWLDLLSIQQCSPEDKSWQITQMGEIYRNCSFCTILTGGLRRLPRLLWKEQTSWVGRIWTLQECVLAPEGYFVFAWNKGTGYTSIRAGGGDADQFKIPIYQINSVAGCSPVSLLISEGASDGHESSPGSVLFQLGQGSDVGEWFVPESTGKAFALYSGSTRVFDCLLNNQLESQVQRTLLRRIKLKDAKLAAARETALWDCTFYRESSLPVDAVFATMALFGTQIDPNSICPISPKVRKNARLAATIRLMQHCLRNGGRAYWISRISSNQSALRTWYYYDRQVKHSYQSQDVRGAHVDMYDPRMCTIVFRPEIEEQNLTDEETYALEDADSRPWRSTQKYYDKYSIVNPHAPQGTLDDYGYLTITVPATRVYLEDHLTPSEREMFLNCLVGGCDSDFLWLIALSPTGHDRKFLAKHGPDRWHFVGFGVRRQWFKESVWTNLIYKMLRSVSDPWAAPTQTLTIGGPYPVMDLWDT